MGPRLDVRPDAFWDAAQTVIGEAMPPAQRTALALCAALDGCAAMAGSDPPGRSWAEAYDGAALAAVRGTRLLLDTSYHLGVLLELTGLNHAHAEAASVAGPSAAVPLAAHGAGWQAVLSQPPSAAGGHSDSPTGLGLIEDAVGYVWPSGHQDRLHSAAEAWDAAADGLVQGADLLPSAVVVIVLLTSPEVDDAVTALQSLRSHYLDLARVDRELARACRELAHQIDVAHSSVEQALVELLEFTGGAEIVGGLLSTVSFGAAELPTQAAVAARVASTAGTVRTVLGTLQTAVELLTTGLPTVAELAESVVNLLLRLRQLRPAIAGFDEVAALPGEMRMAKTVGTAGREIAAQRRLAAAATKTLTKAESKIWKHLKPFRGKTLTNGVQGKARRYYTWDHTHGDIEVWGKGGKHLGSMDATTGKMTKPPVKGRVNPDVK